MTTGQLWQKAAAFAARAHQHQVRKDGGTPYFAHPARVALTVGCVFGFHDETILAAALLHDTIEDTVVDYDELLEGFGKDVADIVAALTKDMRLIEPEREQAYDAQLAVAPWQARLIKLADVYDNLLDCRDATSLEKLAARARRVLELARNDSALAQVRGLVSTLLNAMLAAEK